MWNLDKLNIIENGSKRKFQMILKNPFRQIKMKTQIDKLIRLREHGANKELKEVTHAI